MLQIFVRSLRWQIFWAQRHPTKEERERQAKAVEAGRAELEQLLARSWEKGDAEAIEVLGDLDLLRLGQ